MSCTRGCFLFVPRLMRGISVVALLALAADVMVGQAREVALPGVAAEDQFGYSVAAAGDVNGDGIPDLIIGSPFNDDNGTNAGRVDIFFGGAELTPVPDLTLFGEDAGDNFGRSVAGIGDFNHDGYDDVLIGAPNNAAGGFRRGKAYVFFGGNPMNGTPDLMFNGEYDSDRFGWSVANAGDVNGDTIPDVIIGAPFNDENGGNAGRAYLFFGGASTDTLADAVFTGGGTADNFGKAVGGAGDVNGDSYADVIVGAPGNESGGFYSGQAYVFFGGTSVSETPSMVLTGAPYDNFGASVGSAGHFTSGNYDDVLVGAPHNNISGGDRPGAAYVFFGGTAPDTTFDLVFRGRSPKDFFGFAVASGDENGDGFDDILIGAPFDLGGSTAPTAIGDSGYAFVFHGGSTPDAIADITLHGKQGISQFGYAVSFSGDIEHDGKDDVVAGAPFASSLAGVAYLMYSPGLTTGAAASEDVTTAFGLYQNYPNPFNPSTTIAFRMAREGHASLRIFDLLGREVALLFDGYAAAGEHRVVWNATAVAAGPYFCRFVAIEGSSVRRVMLVK